MSFKNFIESERDSDYLDGISDELNINPEDIKNMILANFQLNGNSYSLASFDVNIDSSGNAIIRMNNNDLGNQFKPKVFGKNMIRKPGLDGRTYFIPRKELVQMLSQGWIPANNTTGI